MDKKNNGGQKMSLTFRDNRLYYIGIQQQETT
jgi:hypothetical protein